MAVNFKVPEYAFSLPWFMYDLFNRQLITSQTIPGDIKDSKDIFLTEIPIPGLNYSPVQSAGNGNRKISFTLPLLKRNNTVGNSLLLQQFHALRNQARGLLNIYSNQFNPNPKVLYYWGTGSLPMEYYVTKCEFTHKQGWTNQTGQPQFSEVNIELLLDENNFLYKAEELFRKVSIYTASALFGIDNIAKFEGRTF
jgi:hypothetical protein